MLNTYAIARAVTAAGIDPKPAGAVLLAAVTSLTALALPVPAQAQAPTPSVCDRTSQVRDVIVSEVSGVSNCANITTTHLAAILEVFSNSEQHGRYAASQSGDFAGLTEGFGGYLSLR